MKIIKSKDFWLIFIIWLVGFFFRTYRLGDLLGFYYDQGRDALRVNQMFVLKDFPAIGPTTGLSGVFLGPLWYYLIAAGYILGKGDPAVAAGFIAFLESLTVFFIYYFAKKFFSQKVAFLSAFAWSCSYYLVRSARWFNNPSPLPLFAVLFLWGLTEWLVNKNKKWLMLVSFCLSVALQLEAAGSIFYFPLIVFLMIAFKVNFRNLLHSRYFWFSAFIFLLFLLPQAAFEVKNNFITSRNLFSFLVGRVNTDIGKSWDLPTIPFIIERFNYYHSTFFSKVDPNTRFGFFPFLIFLPLVVFSTFRKKCLPAVKIISITLLTPMMLLLFFVGNYGNIYDYYLTGFLPAFIVFLSYFLIKLPYLLVLLSLLLFIRQNLILIRYYLIAGVDGPTHITLGNEKQAIDWVCQDKKNIKFNVDTYVPPVIPYSWDYLWLWYGGKIGCYPEKGIAEKLYTVWEIDPPHPERLEAWFKRQEGIGRIENEVRFGGIGVEVRKRLKNE